MGLSLSQAQPDSACWPHLLAPPAQLPPASPGKGPDWGAQPQCQARLCAAQEQLKSLKQQLAILLEDSRECEKVAAGVARALQGANLQAFASTSAALGGLGTGQWALGTGQCGLVGSLGPGQGPAQKAMPDTKLQVLLQRCQRFATAAASRIQQLEALVVQLQADADEQRGSGRCSGAALEDAEACWQARLNGAQVAARAAYEAKAQADRHVAAMAEQLAALQAQQQQREQQREERSLKDQDSKSKRTPAAAVQLGKPATAEG
jgi:hypothetical protein